MVVVTSRDSLTGLVAREGAHRVELDLLSVPEATTLLRRIVGQRAETDARSAELLVELCACLPLVIRVAAELALRRPDTSLRTLVAELGGRRRRLELFHAGSDPRTAVPMVFSWSIRNLPAETARTFAGLGLHPGPDLDAYAAAALAGMGVAGARGHLETLASAHLVHLVGSHRYGMHDLLHAYAFDLATQAATGSAEAQDPQVLLGRLFDYYLVTAATAMARLYPADSQRWPRLPDTSTPSPDLPDRDAARAWLDDEVANLTALTVCAAARDRPAHVIGLSQVLFRYLDAGRYAEAITIHARANEAAELVGDAASQVQALNGLATVLWHRGDDDSASCHLQQALELARLGGDVAGEARTLANLGICEGRVGRCRSDTSGRPSSCSDSARIRLARPVP
jgi:hypothetical protein